MYLNSSSLERFGEHNYLSIYMNKEFPYRVKYDGIEVDMLNLLFKEPDANDLPQLKKLGIALEKLYSYENVKSIRIANLFSSNFLEEIRKNNQEEFVQDVELDEEKQEIDKIAKTRDFVREILLKANDFEDESSNYYLEIDKFFAFLETKCFREHGDGIAIKNSLSVIDKYNAISCFIKEEIVIEYISFFFDHFPSRSLHANLSK